MCLSRPDKMNALDFAMFDGIAAAIDQLKACAAEGSLRAVVLHGEGRAFCAGLDMGRMSKIAAEAQGGFRDLRPRTHGVMNSAQYIAQGWRELPVPVIAAVHGVAFGGGLQVALGEMYLFYAETHEMFESTGRDVDRVPAIRKAAAAMDAYREGARSVLLRGRRERGRAYRAAC